MKNLLSLKKNFVKSTTYLVISLVKPLLSRNFCQKCVRVNFRNFHTVWKLRKFTLTLFWQKFRESNGFTNKITKYLVDLTKYFFSESKFFIFPHCDAHTIFQIYMK